MNKPGDRGSPTKVQRAPGTGPTYQQLLSEHTRTRRHLAGFPELSTHRAPSTGVVSERADKKKKKNVQHKKPIAVKERIEKGEKKIFHLGFKFLLL